MQLKEVYSGTVQEKNVVADENRKLKELLRLHGIPFDDSEPPQDLSQLSVYGSRAGSSSMGGASTSALGLQSASNLSPPAQYQSNSTSPQMFGSPSEYTEAQFQAQQRQPAPQQGSLDYDQLGVDFVLASVSQQPHPQQHRKTSQPYSSFTPRTHG